MKRIPLIQHVFLVAAISIVASIGAMKEKKGFKIIVENKMSGLVTNITADVKYATKVGKAPTVRVSPGEVRPIDNFSKIVEGSTIEFIPYGATVIGALATPVSILQSDLLKEWQAVKTDDSSPLVIKLTATGTVPPYTINVQYVGALPAKKKKLPSAEEVGDVAGKPRNPLEAFSRIKYWKLQGILDVNEINNVPDWDKVLVKPGYIQSETTAEDVYRYILGLGKDYTLDDVVTSNKTLSLKWHPDKIASNDPEDQRYAKEVFQLIDSAFKGLKAALKEKQDEKKDKD